MFKGLCETLYCWRKAFITRFFRLYYSQFGEDVILRDWIAKGYKGFYIDVGCFHPKKFSNTYYLYKHGWRGINIDLDPLKIKTFNLIRKQDHNVQAAVSDQETELDVYRDGKFGLGSTLDKKTAENFGIAHQKESIKTQTLNSIIKDSPYSQQAIDLLSIDAEGHDLQVLKSLDLNQYQPKLIIIETHLQKLADILQSELYQYLERHHYAIRNWIGYSLIFSNQENIKSSFVG